MSEEKKTIRKWGYHPTEDARIFELSEGADLPEGWAARPVPTEAVEPSDEPEADEAIDFVETGKDTGEIAALEAEIVTLKHQLESANARIAELEADADALTIPHPGAPKEQAPDLVPIPDDWAETHHSTRIKLAKQLSPELADAIEKDADAIEVIKAELAKRG